ncbi:hypothetical protein AAGG74_18735 [Bacillus mexicanus]|uniref:hypothetical protein n=1 Tax=Bacillus mexicanus TaxID=2834415 RepID=UPI003D2225A9
MNVLFYCLSFVFILYFFTFFHKPEIKQNISKFIYFTILFCLFAFSYNPYFDWKVWLLIIFLLYCVLDDIFHKEFNILVPLFVTLVFLAMKPNLLTLCAILFVFLTFYLFSVFIFLTKKIFKREMKISNTKKHTKKKNWPSRISKFFSNQSGMGEADPFILLPFLLLLPIIDWIPYLFLSWILVIIFFFINQFKKSKLTSIPLAPILLLSLTIYLLAQQFFYS